MNLKRSPITSQQVRQMNAHGIVFCRVYFAFSTISATFTGRNAGDQAWRFFWENCNKQDSPWNAVTIRIGNMDRITVIRNAK